MIVMPAIDLREGACVQLVGGRYDDERVRLQDPVEVARGWRDDGLSRLHVVDLDAATGRGSNAAVIRALLAEPGLMLQVGGGVRDTGAIEALVAAGAARVVVGTRAIEDPAWLAAAAAAFPRRLVVAADVRGRRITTHGWARDGGPEVSEYVASLASLPLAGVLVTAVHREGALGGADLELMRGLAATTHLELQASGGITSLDDLRELAAAGVAAAVLGMALYTGAVTAAHIVEAFPQ
jgi:phosphoribosylformimino-5-aminoimidazole carboxamide ribotide isomerase